MNILQIDKKNLIMDIDSEKIIKICGSEGDLESFPDIGSDPNFVFKNDPIYETVALYDVEGNIINVNSWIECVHYVKGGWSNNQLLVVNSEKEIFFFLVASISVYLIVKFFTKNFQKN